jgi:hypothetical protein
LQSFLPLAVRVPPLVLIEYHDASPCCTDFTVSTAASDLAVLLAVLLVAQLGIKRIAPRLRQNE